jgi:hypothetical protein
MSLDFLNLPHAFTGEMFSQARPISDAVDSCPLWRAGHAAIFMYDALRMLDPRKMSMITPLIFVCP